MPVAYFSKKKPPTIVGGLCSRYLSSWVGQVSSLRLKHASGMFSQEKTSYFRRRFVFALSIFPGSHPPSIVDVHELNFCVRDGNRWTLMTINTNYSRYIPCKLNIELSFCNHLRHSLSLRFGQAFGLLVSVSYTHYCASTSDLSTT